LNPKRLIDLSDLSSDILSDECLNTIFNFFKERYFSNNHIDSRFETLGLSTNVGNGQESNYTFCHTVFTSNESTKNDKTKATFLVMHRFRNNLFHGRKNPETLNIYEQAFREINKFLIHFIDTTANDALINNRRLIL